MGSSGHTHDHGTGAIRHERPLWWALGLTTTFLVAEVIGGILTHSLALLSDAAHMFTDAAALGISLAAIHIGKRPADARRTFGYHRFEILAAAFNALLLFGVAVYILVEAWQRLRHPPAIASGSMLVIAVLGLVVNLIGMRLLSVGQETSLNVKGAYLEVWSDMLGSIGVIAGALVIRYTGWTWVDPAIAVGIGLWVLPRTWTLLKASFNVLLEGVPDDVPLADVRAALLALPDVGAIHDLHVWAITSGRTSLTVHVVTDAAPAAWPALLERVRALLEQQFDIGHSTVQIESVPCAGADAVHEETEKVPAVEHRH